MQEQIVPAKADRRFLANDRLRAAPLSWGVNAGAETYDNEEVFNEAVVQRVEILLKDIGWDYSDLARRAYTHLQYADPKGVKQWFERSRAIPNFKMHLLSRYLGIGTAYLMLDSDDLPANLQEDGRYALESRDFTRAQRIMELEAEVSRLKTDKRSA